MHKRFLKGSLFVILSISTLSAQGCFALLLGAAVGAGSVAYVKGNLEQNVDAPIEQVHAATLAAAKELALFVVEDTLNAHDAKIKAEYQGGKDVTIELQSLTEKSTQIRVRVGLVGDEPQSRVILNAIHAQL